MAICAHLLIVIHFFDVVPDQGPIKIGELHQSYI